MIVEGAVAGVVMWVCDRLLGRAPAAASPGRAAPRPGPGPAEPPRFTPRQAATLTHERSGRCHFDADVAGRVRAILAARSLTPVPAPDLAGRGSVWAVAPLTPHAEPAIAVVDRLVGQGCTALGSLSLVLLAADPRCPAVVVLVDDPRDAARLADPRGGYLAVLAEPAAVPPDERTAPGAGAPASPLDAVMVAAMTLTAEDRAEIARRLAPRAPATSQKTRGVPTDERGTIGSGRAASPANGTATTKEKEPDAPHPDAETA